jgi:hypothetical protein
MKTKYSFKRGIFLIIIFSLFINCQTDDYEVQKELKNQFPYKTTVIKNKDILSNTKLNNQISNFSTLKSYDFTISTDFVKLIENIENNSHSYTFPIKRSQSAENSLENLVFMYDATSDNYSSSIVTYHFSDTQIQEFISTGHIASSSYDINYTPISIDANEIIEKNSLSSPCTTNFTVYHITPDTEETFLHSSTIGNIHNDCQHEDANGNSTCTSYTIITYDCPDGSSSAGPSSGTNNSTSGSNSSQENDIITSPTIEREEQVLNIDGITLEMNNWLNENLDIKSELITLLEENPEGDDFILYMIEAMIADNTLTIEELRKSQVAFFAPEVPIMDMGEYLQDFTLSEGALVTIYVNQPIPNSDDAWRSTGDEKAGHSSINITQGNVSRTWGLYPEGDADPLAPNDPHRFGNDENKDYHVSITFSVDGSQLGDIINNAVNYMENYDLNDNNCTDYVISTAQLVGITLPDPQKSWVGGGGSCPGAFGEGLRNMILPNGMTRDDNGGITAPNQ